MLWGKIRHLDTVLSSIAHDVGYWISQAYFCVFKDLLKKKLTKCVQT